MNDLFGNEITNNAPLQRRKVHAAMPGTGPNGKTCRGCKHYYRAHYHDKTWLKCNLMREHWTHGPGSDIKASDPACRMFEEKK